MKKPIVLCIMSAVFLWATSVGAVQVPGPLVDTQWLADHMPEVVLLDLRADTKSFTAEAPPIPAALKDKKKLEVLGHIPGARLVDYKAIRSKREIDGKTVDKMIPPKADFEKVMQEAGLKSGDAVVIATKGMSTLDLTMGTRLYWQLKYFGQDNLALLDGGTARWIKEQRPITTETPEVGAGDWTASAERTELFATSEEVAKASSDGALLVDSRPVSQYLGTAKRDYVYAYGHIPGARNYPSDLMTAQDPAGGFLPADQYRELGKVLGVDLDAEAITYCNSGHFASGTWFVMSEILGNKKVKLYDGSMHEWTLEKRPVVSMKAE